MINKVNIKKSALGLENQSKIEKSDIMNVAIIIACLASLFLLSANKPKYGAITEIRIPDSDIYKYPREELTCDQNNKNCKRKINSQYSGQCFVVKDQCGKNSNGFDTWVTETVGDLENFTGNK